ncbi:MAG TPA: hypothetical protein VD932_02640 [Aquabacterium sp.]|nr:hypothetical protein [Aquabacterium sp.]
MLTFPDPITLPQEEVVIGDKTFLLRAANGDAVYKYKNFVLKAISFADGKPTGMNGAADAEPFLVHLCLFEKLPSGAERNVPLATVRSWRAEVIGKLFERAKEISGIDAETKPEEIRAQIAALQERLAAIEGEPKN